MTGLQPVTHHKSSCLLSCLNYFLYIDTNPGCLFFLSDKLRIFVFNYNFGNFESVSANKKKPVCFTQIKLIIPSLVRTSWGGHGRRLCRSWRTSQRRDCGGKCFPETTKRGGKVERNSTTNYIINENKLLHKKMFAIN